MNTVNQVLLRRKNCINMDEYPCVTEPVLEPIKLMTGLKNIQSLGFTFSNELLNKLYWFNETQFEEFYDDLIPKLKKLKGADVKYHPMYPNFPQQVIEMDEVELYVNAFIHYLSDGELLPEYEKDERLPLLNDSKLIVIGVANLQTYIEIIANLVASKTSLSEQDKNDISTAIKNYPMLFKNNCLPKDIPLKENVAFVCKELLNFPLLAEQCIQQYFHTATDVLRLITAWSDGDISLSTNTPYRSLKRKERRLVMDLLSNFGHTVIIEDMFRYKNKWLRVGERLHPFEYKQEKYDYVNMAFNILRNEHKPLLFNGKVELYIQDNKIKEAVELLKTRPSELARKLDKLIRESKDITDKLNVCCAFGEVANKVSTNVLLQVRQHFINRLSYDATSPTLDKKDTPPIRVFFPKGATSKVYGISNNLPIIPDICCKCVIELCDKALNELYAQREPLGKVYIDKELKNYLVPFSQRSASKATKQVVRGSKLPIKQNSNIIRGFIWWTNDGHSRVDIDLSAAIYDEDWNYIEHISYTNLRSARYKACHSGDITNGGNVDGEGVAEFIDIEIDNVAQTTGRYIVFQVNSFTRQKFSTLPNCRFGWMERQCVDSGEIFEPSTVEMKIDLTSNSTVAIPVIFDCIERKFIWCDMAHHIQYNSYTNNLESNFNAVTSISYSLCNVNKTSIYDLVYFNAKARGEIVENKNDANIIFSNNINQNDNDVPVISAFDLDYYMNLI